MYLLLKVFKITKKYELRLLEQYYISAGILSVDETHLYLYKVGIYLY